MTKRVGAHAPALGDAPVGSAVRCSSVRRLVEIGDRHRTASQRFVRKSCPAVVRGIYAELVVQPTKVLLDRGFGDHERGRDFTYRGGLGEEVTIEQRPAQHDEDVALAGSDAGAQGGRLGDGPADIGGIAKEQPRRTDAHFVAVVQSAGREDPLSVHVRAVRRAEVGHAPPGRELVEHCVEAADGLVIVERDVILRALADGDPVAGELDRAPAGDRPDLDGGAHGPERTRATRLVSSKCRIGGGNAVMTKLIRDRYEPLEVVGEGGEGRLVKALDRQHGRFVALKLRTVASDADRELMLNEARVLLALPPHSNLPLVRDDFFEDDHYVIVMDWVDGVDLGRVLRSKGRPGLAPSSVVAWLAEVAGALTHLHTQDRPVIHGDVKPANLVLTRGGHIVLVDFGISTAARSSERRLGTAGFAAPELVTGAPASRASDVYALAATAYALLTGAPPTGIRSAWEGIDPEQAAALETSIRAGLATDPMRRPRTPGEFVERLRAGWGSTLPTGVLTFCLTDIEGSTPAWERDPSSMAHALVRHDEIIGETVELHGGRFLQSMGEGDSTVSVFSAAEHAVTAAIDCQRRLRAEVWPGDLALAVRMALHTGEADHRGSDYFGPTLSVGARVRGLADGNQIFLSGTTAALVAESMPTGATLVELGPHRLRGVQEPVPVFAVAARGVDAPPSPTECPYQGLLAFDVDDSTRFFGRSNVVHELMDRVRGAGFVALVGSSGSGKSSILRAGLLPAFSESRIVTPGEHPPEIECGPSLLVVDQFEELFTLCHDDDERAAFIDAVLAYDGPVVIGMRADFYGSCASHPALAAAVAGEQLLLGPMSDEELREAIIEPAHTCGLRVEGALVDLLVREVSGEPGALPLLSHSLLATWAARDGRTLTLDAYRRTGGVRAAIATTADRVLGALDPRQQVLARQVLLRVVEPGEATDDTRRRAALAEFAGPDESEVTAILARLTDARLVTVDEVSVQLAHEALIREWPQLQRWLDEDRAALRLHRHLTAAAQAWVAAGRDAGELYRGQRLAAVSEWRASGPALSTTEEEFVDASVAEQDRVLRVQMRTNRRLRVLLGAVAVVLVIALVAGAIAFVQRRRAADARDRADVARVAAVSRSVIDRQADLGLLLAVAADRLDPTTETRNTLLSALTAHPLLLGLLHGSQSGLEAATFSPDGATLATPTSDGTGTILWDTRTHRRVTTLLGQAFVNLGADFSPDGRWLAVPAISSSAREAEGSGMQIWDVHAQRLARLLPSPSGSLSSAAWSRDGKTLIAQGGVTRSDASPPTTVIVWDTGTWQPRGGTWKLSDSYTDDRVLAVSDDARRLALPLFDGLCRCGTFGHARRSARLCSRSNCSGATLEKSRPWRSHATAH